MLEDIKLWPDKLIQGKILAKEFFLEHRRIFLATKFKKVAFVGMGGSGVIGRITKTFLDRETNLESIIINSPNLPHSVDSNTLVFLLSYSGNTWECLDVFNQLLKKNIVPIILTSLGGLLEKIAKKNRLNIVKLPLSLAPRSALGHFLSFIFSFLNHLNFLNGDSYLEEMILFSQKQISFFSKKTPFIPFLKLFKKKSFFHVWGIENDSSGFAYRATTQFNENSKTQAVFNIFPELCHNLIEGFENSKKNTDFIIFFHTNFLHAKLKKTMKVLEELLKEKTVQLYKPPILGNTFAQQAFNIILWSDFASYYLGCENKVKICEVKNIEMLKEKQRQIGVFK